VMPPAMLYMGYVGFSVAFAFAAGGPDRSRLGRRVGAADAALDDAGMDVPHPRRRLGSFWAYYELGWGGGVWDPVENGLSCRWLVGTALMHSLAVTGKTRRIQGLDRAAPILRFSPQACLGTFLVRSGRCSPRFTPFATDPGGIFILIFLGIVVGGSLALFAARAPRLVWAGLRTGFARTMLLVNNVLLLVSPRARCCSASSNPLVLDALGLGRFGRPPISRPCSSP